MKTKAWIIALSVGIFATGFSQRAYAGTTVCQGSKACQQLQADCSKSGGRFVASQDSKGRTNGSCTT